MRTVAFATPTTMTPFRDVDLGLPEVANAPRPWRFVDNTANYQYDWDGSSWILADEPDAITRLPVGDYCLPTGAFPWVPCRLYQSKAITDFVSGNKGPYYPPGGGHFSLQPVLNEDSNSLTLSFPGPGQPRLSMKFTLISDDDTEMTMVRVLV